MIFFKFTKILDKGFFFSVYYLFKSVWPMKMFTMYCKMFLNFSDISRSLNETMRGRDSFPQYCKSLSIYINRSELTINPLLLLLASPLPCLLLFFWLPIMGGRNSICHRHHNALWYFGDGQSCWVFQLQCPLPPHRRLLHLQTTQKTHWNAQPTGVDTIWSTEMLKWYASFDWLINCSHLLKQIFKCLSTGEEDADVK